MSIFDEIIAYNTEKKTYTITPNTYFSDPSLYICVKSARFIN